MIYSGIRSSHIVAETHAPVCTSLSTPAQCFTVSWLNLVCCAFLRLTALGIHRWAGCGRAPPRRQQGTTAAFSRGLGQICHLLSIATQIQGRNTNQALEICVTAAKHVRTQTAASRMRRQHHVPPWEFMRTSHTAAQQLGTDVPRISLAHGPARLETNIEGG